MTGSKHLLRTSRATVLLDCGLFQGRRQETFARNRDLPIDASKLDAVVLSHAHIDYSGALPVLCRRGYRGPILATSATRDFVAPMLLDAALLQEADARHIARLIERGADIAPVTPLYGEEDVMPVLDRMIGLPYRRAQAIAPGITLRFLDAGHVLGSAVAVLDIDEDGRTTRVAYTGDLGDTALPILPTRKFPTASKPGHREHVRRLPSRSHREMGEALAEVVRRTAARGGKVVIPSFALGTRPGDRLSSSSACASRSHSPGAGLRGLTSDGEADRCVSPAPGVLRQGDPAATHDLVAVRFRRIALHLGRGRLEGHRR